MEMSDWCLLMAELMDPNCPEDVKIVPPYVPGAEEFLSEYGLKTFVVDESSVFKFLFAYEIAKDLENEVSA